MADKLVATRQGEWKALEASLKREKRGRDLYQKRATEAKNLIARVTFEILARRQERLLELIERVTRTVQSKSNLPYGTVRLPILQLVETVIERVLKEANGSSAQETGVVHDDIFRAYLWALGFEEKGAEMYARLVQRAEQKSLVELFDFLRKRKGEHYRILDQTLALAHSPEISLDRITNSPICRQGG